MKKLLAVLMVFTMLFSAFSMISFAATEPFAVTCVRQGNGEPNELRFVVTADGFPEGISVDSLVGKKIIGTFTDNATGDVLDYDSTIVSVETTSEGYVIVAATTDEVPQGNYYNDKAKTHTIALTIYPDVDGSATVDPSEQPTSTPSATPTASAAPTAAPEVGEPVDEDPFDLVYTNQGTKEGTMRFVVKLDTIPFEVTENSMVGMKVKGTLTDKETKEVLNLDSVIVANEMRDGSTVIVVAETDEVPAADYDGTEGKTHTLDLQVYPREIGTLPGASASPSPSATPSATPSAQPTGAPIDTESFDLVYTNQGTGSGAMRFVVKLDTIPFEVTENSMAGMAVKGTLTDKETGEVLNLDSVITANEMRDGSTVIVVAATDEVPAKDYDGDKGKTHTLDLQVYPNEIVEITPSPSPSTDPSVNVEFTDKRPDDEVAVKFNGKYIVFDASPMIDPATNRTLVPMRAIFEALGCTVNWDEATQTASGERKGKTVSVTIGSNQAMINNKLTIIDQPAAIVQDRTMVPVRFISESFDANVDWDAATNTVIIISANN